jgi:TonB family protein
VEVVMAAVSQKIRTGVVELRADIGSVYVSPSFWERIYLLWMFRNFHRLPKQVLNRHQRQLIDKLCRAAIVNRNGPIAGTSIIGAVENVSLMPDCKTEALTTTSKLVAMSTTSADVVAPRAVGSEGSSVRSSRVAYNRTGVGRFPKRSANVHYISTPQKGSAEQSGTKKTSQASVDSDQGRVRSRTWLEWALVAACWAALLGILFYSRQGRRAPSTAVPQVAFAAQQPGSGSIPSAAVAQPGKVPQSMPSVREHPATIIALNSPSPAVSSRQESAHRETLTLTQPSIATVDSPPAERLQVAEAPEHGFSYPVAPNPALSGKVSLKAVIGTDGTVREVDVLSGNRMLAGAAVRAVRQWRYRPYELNGHAVEAETNIAISFVGDDAVSVSFPTPH